uniref:Uncharacterized protein n=1 Tax=Chlamydomonas chlamydogama TaxID=225041 RepID=A0A7S2VW20_9CHLO
MVAKPGKEEDAKALVNLLSPQGKLFHAMHSADADKLIQYIFPVERLPAHTQELLKTFAGRRELERWPQYAGHLAPADPTTRRAQPQVVLDVFGYFAFWTAFYVLRGSRSADVRGYGGGSGHQQWGRSYMSDIKRMGSNLLPGLGTSGTVQLQSHPYYELLRMYLHHFLPRTKSGAGDGAGVAAGSRGGPRPEDGGRMQLGAYGSQYGSSGRLAALGKSEPGTTLGNILLSVLVEFWLTDVAEPVPVDVADKASLGPSGMPQGAATGPAGPSSPMTGAGAANAVASPGALMPISSSPQPGGQAGPGPGAGPTSTSTSVRVLSYQPPSEELIEGLTQLVRYMTAAPEVQAGGKPVLRPAQMSEPWLPPTPIRTFPPAQPSRLQTPLPPGGLLCSPSSSPAVQAVSRKLYRLLRRTFAQWPLPASTSLAPIIHLWLSVLAPWTTAYPSSYSTSPTKAAAAPSGTSPPHSGLAGGGVHLPLASELAQRFHLPGGSMQEPGGVVRGIQGCYTPEWRQHVLAHLPFYTILIPHFIELTYARMAFRCDAALRDLLRVLDVLADSPALLKELKCVEGVYNRYLQSPLRRPEGEYADILAWCVDQAHDWEAAAAAGAPTNPPIQVDAMYRLFTTDSCSAAFYAVAVLQAGEAQLARPNLRRAVAEAAAEVLPLSEVPRGQVQEAAVPLSQARQFPRAGHWQDLRYRGDWMKRPIASNEIGILVRLLVWLSELVNRLLGLDVMWTSEEEEEPPETVLQQILQWMRRKQYRVNLRFLAELQTLAWLVGLYLVLQLFGGTAKAPMQRTA